MSQLFTLFSLFVFFTMEQTVTNITPYLFEWKQSLKNSMVGKKLSELRTPSLVIDKAILKRNCQQLGKIRTELNTNIRIHVKTHKVNLLLYYINWIQLA